MGKNTEKKLPNINKIKETFEKVNNNKRELALALLQKAEFLEETLKKLEAEIKKSGVITTMCQGDYDIERENPALKSYNTTIKNYTSVVKQLSDMLPKEENQNNDDFDEFGEEN